jgi:DNA topoisomerase-3
MKGFKSRRTGKTFSAALRIGAEGKVELFFPEGEALGPCRLCGQGEVRDKGKVWSCDHEGCTLVIFKEVSRRPLSAEEARRLLAKGTLEPLEGFVSKEGRPFRAGLLLSEGRVRFDFAEERLPIPASAPLPPAGPPSASAAHGTRDPTGAPCPECGQGKLMRGRTGWGCSRWREGCRYVIRDP